MAKKTKNPTHDLPVSPLDEKVKGRFSIEDRDDCWRIGGVVHRGKVLTVDLSKELLDGEDCKTQDEWIAYSLAARREGNPYVGDL